MNTSLTTPGDSSENWKPERAPALTSEEAVCAVDELSKNAFVKKFPKVDRNYADPPIALQQVGLFSFIPAKGATPNEKGIYGFAKLRGNYATEMEAEQRAEQLIRECDSVHTIFHTYVGRPFPVTLNENYAAETSEVDIRRDTIEAVSNTIKEKKADEKRRAQELQEREQELLEDTAKDKPAELIEQDDYITMKVKKAQLTWTYLEHVNKLKEIKDIIVRTRAQLVEADAKNPALIATFYDKYKLARSKAGLKCDEQELSSGFTKYLVEDVELPGIDTHVDSLIEDVVNLVVKSE
jgi:hypothetical protein